MNLYSLFKYGTGKPLVTAMKKNQLIFALGICNTLGFSYDGKMFTTLWLSTSNILSIMEKLTPLASWPVTKRAAVISTADRYAFVIL